MTNSIKMDLVPANDMHLSEKTFTWRLLRYDEDEIGIKVDFDYPIYISVGGIDTLKIQFYNNEKYLNPQNEELQPLPEGYTVIVKLPP